MIFIHLKYFLMKKIFNYSGLFLGVSLAFASCCGNSGSCGNPAASDSLETKKDTTAVPACTVADKSAELLASEWKVTTIGGDSVSYKENGAGFKFDAEKNAIHGNTGCNIFNASYVIDKCKIQFVPGQVTMMACLDGELEAKYLDAMSKVAAYSIENDVLTLKDSVGANLMQLNKVVAE